LALRLQERQAAFITTHKTPAEARRALELLGGTAPGALATPETDE